MGPIEEEEEGTVSVFFLKKLKKLKKILAVFFLVFLAKPKMLEKRRNVTNVTNLQPAQGSFQKISTCRSYVWPLSFGSDKFIILIWRLVLGLKSGSDSNRLILTADFPY